MIQIAESTNHLERGTADMKSFNQFIKESITINGDFNGTIVMGGSQPEQAQESFFADVVWEGKIYRLEVEGSMMSKGDLAEHIQGEYPGAIVHQIYPGVESNRIKSSSRYQPEKLTWSD